MFKVHVISDLDYNFNEFSDPIDLDLPEVDLIIINGNISDYLKRSMLYAEQIANKYRDIPVIFNRGELERFIGFFPKFDGEGEESVNIRQWANPTWPKNLYFENNIKLNLKSGDAVDILCAYGFPLIHEYEGAWENTHWYKNYVAEVTENQKLFIPYGVSDVYSGQGPIWATKEWINKQHMIELEKIKKWEINKTSYKILVTQINPYNDHRYKNQKVTSFNIHLANKLWITTGQTDINYVGAKLRSNPGRGLLARRKVLSIDT